MTRRTPMTDLEIMADIKRRHSPLHKVDGCCGRALRELLPLIPIASDHGLKVELEAVHAALVALHAAAKAKWEATR